MTFRFFHLLSEFDKLSQERKKQWILEEQQEIDIQECDANVIIKFLLTRNTLNRELSKQVQSSSLYNKLEKYNEYIDKINVFNEEIDKILKSEYKCNILKKFLITYMI